MSNPQLCLNLLISKLVRVISYQHFMNGLRMNEWMNERTNERTNERMEWMNEWMDGWMDGWTLFKCQSVQQDIVDTKRTFQMKKRWKKIKIGMLRMLIICIKIYNRCKILQNLQFWIFLRNLLSLPNLIIALIPFLYQLTLPLKRLFVKL